VATRRHVTQEYKDQAVSLVLDSDRTIAEVAKSTGVHEMTFGKWVKKAKDSGAATTLVVGARLDGVVQVAVAEFGRWAFGATPAAPGAAGR
jgi:transposase-like protein